MKFCKIGCFRGEEFRIYTKIIKLGDEFIIAKYPLNEKANKHIEMIHLNSKRTYGKIKCLESVFEDNVLYYPYIEESILSHDISNLLVNDSDKKKVIEILKRFYDSLKFNSRENDDYHTEEFSKVFGDKRIDGAFHCHDVSNIDLILNNLFIVDDEFVAIDCEWCFDFPVPIEFIFRRTINFELNTNHLFRKFFTVEEIFEIFGLNTDWINVFISWDGHFIKYFNWPNLPRQDIISGRQLIMESNKNRTLIQERNEEIKSLEKTVKELKKDNLKAESEVKKLKKANAKLSSKISLMEESDSWKVTAPLRKIMGKIRKIK